MLHIKKIIPKILDNLSLSHNINNDIIFQEAEKIIKKSTPDVEVLFYKNKILTIKCFNSITANELFLNQEKIKDKINKSLKKETIKKIIIKT